MKKRVVRNGGGSFLWFSSGLLIVCMVCLGAPASRAVSIAWVHHYSNVISNSHDVPATVVRDSGGNIIVAGYTDDTRGMDGLVFKLSGANGSVLWHKRYNGATNRDDAISAAAVDAHDDVVVAGRSFNGTDYDLFVVKYAAADGAMLWQRTYDGPAHADDEGTDVAIDANGNVIVTGGSAQNPYRDDDDENNPRDYYTAKYAGADGTLLWEQRYNGPGDWDDRPRAVAVDATNNVVVTGSSYGPLGADYYTAKYSGTNGVLLWQQRYDGPLQVQDSAQALALDKMGNVVVTGGSAGTNGPSDYYTVKYSGTNGVLLWEQRYNGPADLEDFAQAVKVDSNGNVIVTGYSLDFGYVSAYYTAKYAAADGALLWEKRYNDPANIGDAAQALGLDQSGNVVVTGYSYNERNEADFYTIKYAATNGAVLWERRYNGPTDGEDRPTALTVDDTGAVVVTGGSTGGYDPDFYTTKYATTDGQPLWEHRYTARSRDSGVGECVAVDAGGNVIVTGSSEGNDSGFDYYTAKYSPTGALLWEQRYDSPYHAHDLVRAMVLDADGNAIVTGYSFGTLAADYHTIKYAAGNGAILWEQRYNGPGNWDDRPTSLVLDGDGNVIVTGYSSTAYGGPYGLYTAKYLAADGALMWEQLPTGRTNIGGAEAVGVDASGNVFILGFFLLVEKLAAADGAVLWSRPFNGEGVDLKVDRNGDVIVTGRAQDYSTVKYAGADGTVLWEKPFEGAPWALALDAQGNAIVTGLSYGPNSSGAYTVKYAAADGALLWQQASTNGSGIAKAVAVDENGDVLIAGSADNGRNRDYLVAKYAATDGAVLWEQLWDGLDRGEDGVENRGGLALGTNGMVVVTGVTDGLSGGGWGYGYATVVYGERNQFRTICFRVQPTSVTICWQSEPGRTYYIDYKPTLTTADWTPVSGAIIAQGTEASWTGLRPPGSSAFYRVVRLGD